MKVFANVNGIEKKIDVELTEYDMTIQIEETIIIITKDDLGAAIALTKK